MSELPVIEARGLTKRFGEVPAVDNLTFRVERGQVVGLLGPNGAGKTTTLRMLLGLVRPDAGEASILGEGVLAGSPVLARVGAFVDGPGFVPHLSGRRNLQLYWRAGSSSPELSNIEEALSFSGLGEAADRKVKTYSHGMKQRLGFAQAMLGKPDLMVLDEPASGLDPQQIVELRHGLLRLASGGTTILLSSHLLAEVEQTCGYVLVVDRGKLVRSGTVAEITSGHTSAYFEVDDAARAIGLLRAVKGIGEISLAPPGGIVVVMAGARRSDLVAVLVGGGIRVETVTSRHNLEDVFLAITGDLAP